MRFSAIAKEFLDVLIWRRDFFGGAWAVAIALSAIGGSFPKGKAKSVFSLQKVMGFLSPSPFHYFCVGFGVACFGFGFATGYLFLGVCVCGGGGQKTHGRRLIIINSYGPGGHFVFALGRLLFIGCSCGRYPGCRDVFGGFDRPPFSPGTCSSVLGTAMLHPAVLVLIRLVVLGYVVLSRPMFLHPIDYFRPIAWSF